MEKTDFEVIGPIHLPLGWTEKEVKDGIVQYFEFPKGRYIAASIGKVHGEKNIPVRIQSACTLGDLFGSKWCDCDWQLKEAKRLLFEKGKGLLIHAFDQHGKGIGLKNHMKVYAEGQKRKMELLTEAFDFLGLNYDCRSYEDTAEILKWYKLTSIELFSNDPARLEFFKQKGFQVKRIPLEPVIDEYNIEELKIKKEKFGHLLSFQKN